jgi:hypothetical protein
MIFILMRAAPAPALIRSWSVLATSTLRRIEEGVGNLAISAHSMSEPRIDDEQSNKIKQRRGIATRYDKLTADHPAFVKLASIRI